MVRKESIGVRSSSSRLCGEERSCASNATTKRKSPKRKYDEWSSEEGETSSDDDLQWIASHLNEDFIIWSSDPKRLPPSLDGPQLTARTDGVIHTFFVNSPSPSTEESKSDWAAELDAAAKLLHDSPAVLVVAGAGIGVDSGLPDYRGPDGFWKAYPAVKKLGVSLADISHPDWFENDPTAAWGFYGHRANLYREAAPHQGFLVLRELLTGAKSDNYFVFTSNIDGQFQKAGFAEDKIYECHGSLHWLQCSRLVDDACVDRVWDGERLMPEVDETDMVATSPLPHCRCGRVARPNVSMFGDTSETWIEARSEQQKARLLAWLRGVRQKRQQVAIVEIGCGTSMHSVSIESEALLADDKRKQFSLIRINPGSPQVPLGGHVGIGMGALAALTALDARLSRFRELKIEPELPPPPKRGRPRKVEQSPAAPAAPKSEHSLRKVEPTSPPASAAPKSEHHARSALPDSALDSELATSSTEQDDRDKPSPLGRLVTPKAEPVSADVDPDCVPRRLDRTRRRASVASPGLATDEASRKSPRTRTPKSFFGC
eukprot:TRINITY_DN18734_c0_g1_i1.p1 TRINITY_DN18734_c0_g1~~TRINITY_DN18734_c0_g1_i1.p1  ORF type:complete len:545 (-),score=113.24 TRINITY_DN18734_c0_g1_i1:106-1740(-)